MTDTLTEWDAVEIRALQSLLDVVWELCVGLAAGQVPESEWAEVVADTFDKHRAELRSGEVSE